MPGSSGGEFGGRRPGERSCGGRADAPRWAVAAAALAAPACFAASFASPGLWWLMPVALALFAWSSVAGRCRRTLFAGALVGWLGAWGWLQWWIADVSQAGYPAFVAYLVIWPVATVIALRAIATRGPTARLPLAVLLPIAWVGIEFLRGEILFHGYPWYLAGHPIVEAPILAQAADLLGVPFVGTLVALVAGTLADVAIACRTPDAGPGASQRARRGLAIAAVAATASLGYGAWRLAQTDDLIPGPDVLAIQTNLPVSNKRAWAPEQQVRDFDLFARQTVDAFRLALEGGRAPDLVAWPETMLPGFGLEPDAVAAMRDGGWFPGDHFARAIVELATALRRPMLVGSPAYLGLRVVERRIEWTHHHNAAYLVEPLAPAAGFDDEIDALDAALADFDAARPRPIQRADKLFLTPFGETMPYISAWPWLERTLLSIGAEGMTFDLDVGEAIVRLPVAPAGGASTAAKGDPGDGGHAGDRSHPGHACMVAAPICFEDTVAWLCRRMIFGETGDPADAPVGRSGKRADLFVNLSNDGWFGASDAGRLQHAQIARWRCIENRVPMIRCVNTGASVAIDSCGRLVAAVGPLGGTIEGGYGAPRIAGALLASPPLDTRRPLASRVGDLWGWTMLVGLALLCVGAARSVAAAPPATTS